MTAKIVSLLDGLRRGEHIVTVQLDESPFFGTTWQPICLEEECGYRGPFVPLGRAHAIATEHRQKSVGTWKVAR